MLHWFVRHFGLGESCEFCNDLPAKFLDLLSECENLALNLLEIIGESGVQSHVPPRINVNVSDCRRPRTLLGA